MRYVDYLVRYLDYIDASEAEEYIKQKGYVTFGPVTMELLMRLFKNDNIDIDTIRFRDSKYFAKAQTIGANITGIGGYIYVVVINSTANICSPYKIKAACDCMNMFAFHKYGLGRGGYNVIKTIDISELDTSEVVNMSYMFHDICLENIILGDMDTSKTECAYRMFRGCTSLKRLDISSLRFSNNCDTDELVSLCNKDIEMELGDNKIIVKSTWLGKLVSAIKRVKYIREYKLKYRLEWAGVIEVLKKQYKITDIDTALRRIDNMLVDGPCEAPCNPRRFGWDIDN